MEIEDQRPLQLSLEIREERQASPVEDPVGAYVAVARPIIAGVLQSIASQYLDAYDGDRQRVPLKMLGKLRATPASRSSTRSMTLFGTHSPWLLSGLRTP